LLSELPRIMFFGSTGFLGSALCQGLLEKGVEVSLVSRNLEILTEETFGQQRRTGPTTFISAAWISNSKKGYLYDDKNFEWAKKHIEIAKFCQRNNFRLIIPGTCLEYLDRKDVPYIASKLKVLDYLQENFPAHGFLWIRYFYIFSLNDRRPRIVAEALRSSEEGRVFQVQNLEAKHDYIELQDAVQQTTEMIFNNYHGIWDIGSGSLRSNAQLLSKITGLQVKSEPEHRQHSDFQVSWSGPAMKLIPNHSEFNNSTNQFFDSL